MGILADFLAAAPVRRVVVVDSSGNDANPVKKFDWSSAQAVPFTATSARSAAINATEVSVSMSSAGWLRFGPAGSVTAGAGVAGSVYRGAGGPFFFQINSGEAVAVVRATADGVLAVHPIT
jgi:hypothetical protein